MYTIRPALRADMRAVTDIYAAYVKDSMSTFAYEEEAPTVIDFENRLQDLTAGGFPFLVLVVPASSALIGSADKVIAGYAYAGPFRPRAGWRFTVEDSIYLQDGHHGKGYGSALLSSLIDACRTRGYHSIMAAISMDEGTGDGKGSVALHKKLGFVECGRIREAGFKFDRWCDCCLMQLSL